VPRRIVIRRSVGASSRRGWRARQGAGGEISAGACRPSGGFGAREQSDAGASTEIDGDWPAPTAAVPKKGWDRQTR